MVIALSPHTPRHLEAKADADLPVEQRTVWLYRPPTHGWLESQPEQGRKPTEIVAEHLAGWLNLRGEDGLEIAFPGTGAEGVKLIPYSEVLHISSAIFASTMLTTEEKGK